MLYQVSVRANDAPLPVEGGTSAVFSNGGPSTVYYGPNRTVTSTTGTSIASGASATLTGTQYLAVAATQGSLAKVQINAPSTTGGTGPQGAAGAAGATVLTFSRAGVLSTGTGTLRIPVSRSLTIAKVRAMVGTAPTGASIKVDVNKNGTTIYTTQANRPTIAISGTDSGAGTAPDVTALVAGDYLTLDIDQIGSTVQGSDLTVVIEAS